MHQFLKNYLLAIIINQTKSSDPTYYYILYFKVFRMSRDNIQSKTPELNTSIYLGPIFKYKMKKIL